MRSPPPVNIELRSGPLWRLAQGAWQLCLDSVLGNRAPQAATFLQGGCRELCAALGLEQLLLAPLLGGQVPGAAESAIYW